MGPPFSDGPVADLDVAGSARGGRGIKLVRVGHDPGTAPPDYRKVASLSPT